MAVRDCPSTRSTRSNVEFFPRTAHTWSTRQEAGFNRAILSLTSEIKVGGTRYVPLGRRSSASATVGGLLAPRLDFTAAVAFTSGTVGLTGQDNGFGTTTATTATDTGYTDTGMTSTDTMATDTTGTGTMTDTSATGATIDTSATGTSGTVSTTNT